MQSDRSVLKARRIRNFRAGLLVGASVVAILTVTPAFADGAPPATPPLKWQPYATVGGTVGGESGDTISSLRVIGFAPVWQDLNSLLYVRLGAGTQTHDGLITNFGAGYRTELNDDWIAGAFAGFDETQTRYNHTFWQGSLGAEAMSTDWDIRVNGYLSTQNQARDIPNAYKLYIQDTRIAILQGQEKAYSGFDGEVGYRIFGDGTTDVRLFAGGFSFTRDSSKTVLGGHTFDLGPGDIQGPLGRVEATLYDLDMFGPKSRLILSGVVSHDDVRGTSGYAGVSLQIPIGDTDAGGSGSENELDRRMVDPVRRQDNVLTEFGYSKPEPVIIYNGTITSEPTNTLYYVDNHSGAGSYADPTTLHDATARGPVNQFIVLTDRDGPVNSTGTVVQHGETVTGPGTFKVRGVDSGRTFTHDFAPGSGPVTVDTTDGITLDSDTNLYGVTITGAFTNAIYGHNVSDVIISGVTIDGGGAGGNGIYIVQDNGGSGSISIDHTTITGVTQDGIKLVVDNATGSTSGTTLQLSHDSVDAGMDGVNVTSTTLGGSDDTIYAGIHDSTISGGTDDVIMTGTVFAGSTLNQTLVVDPTHISGGLYGIYAGAYADGGTLTQKVNIFDVDISDTALFGVAAFAQGVNGATVTQDVALSNVHITNPGFVGAAFVAFGDNGSTVHQNVDGSNLTIDGAGIVGLGGAAIAFDGSTVTQSIILDHVTVNGGYVQAAFANAALYGSTATQIVDIADFTGTSSGNAGKLLSSLLGYLPVGYYYLNPTDVGALDALNVAYGNATANQTVILSGETTSGYGAAFTALAVGYDHGTAHQYIDATGLAITGSRPSVDYGDVVYIGADANGGGHVTQVVGLDNVTVSGGAHGIEIYGYANGGSLTQDVALSDTTVTSSYYAGLAIGAGAMYGGHVAQNVHLSNVQSGGYDSLDVTGYGYGGTIAQSVVGSGVTLHGNVYIDEASYDYGSTSQSVMFSNLSLDAGAGGGAYPFIHVGAYGIGGNVWQGVLLDNTGAPGSALDFVSIRASALDGSTVEQYAYLYHLGGSTFGLEVSAFSIFGGNINQTAAVSNLQVTNYLDVSAYSSDDGGSVVQHAGLSHIDSSATLDISAEGGFPAPGNIGDAHQYVTLSNVQVQAAIALDASAVSGDGVAVQSITAQNSTFDGGLRAVANAVYGGSVNQLIALGHAAFTDAGQAIYIKATSAYAADVRQGVYLTNTAGSGGTVSSFYAGATANRASTTDQYVGLYDLNASVGGVDIWTYARHDSGIDQQVHIAGATLAGDMYFGARATDASTATQLAILDGAKLSLTGNYFTADLYADATSSAHQGVGLYNTSANGGAFSTIQVQATAFGSTPSSQLVVLNALNATADGVYLTGDVGATGHLNQTLTADHLTVNATSYYGVYAYAESTGGTLGQYLSLNHVAVSGAEYNQILVAADATNNGTVTQDAFLRHVDTTGGYVPIAVVAQGYSGAKINQYDLMSNVTATGGAYDNIDLIAYGSGGAKVHQDTLMSYVTATGSLYGDGVFAYAGAFDGATTIQHVHADHLTATDNYFSGFDASAQASNATVGLSAVTGQYVSITNSDLSNNGFDGVFAIVSGSSQSVARQDIYIAGSTLDHNAFSGIDAQVQAGFYGAAQQYVTLIGVDASYNGFSGADFGAEALALGSAQQNIYVLGGTFNNNAGNGILITADTFFAGQVLQNAGIYDVAATGNGADGLSISTSAYGYGIGAYAAYYSHVGQNVIAAYDDFSHNARNGVEVQNHAGYGAQVDQLVYLFDSHMDHNGPTSGPIPQGAGNGLYVYSKDEAFGYYGGAISTNLYSDIYVVASSANHNVADGMAFIGITDGPSYLIQHLVVEGSTANYNGGSGLLAFAGATDFYSLNIQYITLAGSTFNHNTGYGAVFGAFQNYGPLSFGAAIQDVAISGSTFNHNGADGLLAWADASGLQGRAEQHFTISDSYFNHNAGNGATFTANAHDGVYLAGYDCGQVQGLYGGCAFVRQTVQAVGSQFDYNGHDGIYVHNTADNYGAVYNSSGRPVFGTTLLVAYSDVSHNTAFGVDIDNHASNNSYIYSYFVGLGSTFDHNGYGGVHVYSDAESGSLVIQKTILYGVPGYLTSSASYNTLGDGVSVDSTATGGTVQQLVGVYGTYLYGNGDSGVKVGGHAYEPTVPGATGWAADPTVSVVSQYVNAIGNVFAYNGVGAAPGAYEGGLLVGSFAYGAHSTAQAYVTALGNGFIGNYVGLGVGGFAYFGGSTNQYVDSEHNVFGFNAIGEIFIDRAAEIGFAKLGLYDANNSALYNGIGIGIVADAEAGSNVQQNLGIYYDNLSHNTIDGLAIRTNSAGYAFGSSYIYYSHVTQNLIAAVDTFDTNGADGIHVFNNNYYGGASNQFLYFVGVEADNNGGAGFYEKSVVTSFRGNSFAFNTNQSSSVYLVASTFDHNTGNGIDLRSYNYGPTYHPAFFGGYSYQIQHTFILGTDASSNGGKGLNVSQNAQGVYGLNAQYFTISGSTFDHNTGAGAAFVSSDTYGPGGFGDTFQQATITGSDFSYNGGDGLDLTAEASGRQGRAEQHFTISGSTFDHNGGDGVHIYASATNGVYIAGHPCTTVQGLPGGCAFVRQNVTIIGSDMSYNSGNGVSVVTYADNYGAIYGASGRPHAPTLELYGDTVNHNGGRGLDVSNHISGNSYLYQYVAAIDSNFDHNSSDGVYSASYVGGASTMLQRELLYSYHTGASAAYNAGNGFKSSIEALGGSYARDVDIVEGADLSHDGSFGFDGAVAYADGTSTGLQINAVYFNTVNYNGDGIGLYSIGSGAQQITYIGGNEVGHNAFVGVYGEANFGAFQYIGVYTFGNNVHDNGTDYLFNSFGGSTQILN